MHNRWQAKLIEFETDQMVFIDKSVFNRLRGRVYQVGFSIGYTRPCRVGYWILLIKSNPGICRVGPKNLINTQMVCVYIYTFFIRLYWLEEILSKIYQNISKHININITAKIIINVNPVSNFDIFCVFYALSMQFSIRFIMPKLQINI